jgi:hypothetical protein
LYNPGKIFEITDLLVGELTATLIVNVLRYLIIESTLQAADAIENKVLDI